MTWLCPPRRYTAKHYFSILAVILVLAPAAGWTQSYADDSAIPSYQELDKEYESLQLESETWVSQVLDIAQREKAINSEAKRLIKEQSDCVKRSYALLDAGGRNEAIQESERGHRILSRLKEHRRLVAEGVPIQQEYTLLLERRLNASTRYKESLQALLELNAAGTPFSDPAALIELALLNRLLGEFKNIQSATRTVLPRMDIHLSELEQSLGL